MNDEEKMQKLADALNKIGNKYHPDNQWVLVGGGSNQRPDIRLIGKDGNTHKGVHMETAEAIKNALCLSGLYPSDAHDDMFRKNCYPLEVDYKGVYTDTGLSVLRIEPSDSTLSLKDIEEIAANYDKLIDTVFDERATSNRKIMQVLANTLNKIGDKYHPDNRWVVMGGSVDNPGIRLIGKDGNTHKGVNKATAGKIQKALSLSGLYNDLYGDDTVSREDCYPLEIDERATYLDTGLTVLRIETEDEFNFGSMLNTIRNIETIKNIGANYEKHMEEEFGKKANAAENTMQTLADTLNKAGAKYHPNHEWKVIGEGIRLINKNGDVYDGVDRDTFDNIAHALTLAGMYRQGSGDIEKNADFIIDEGKSHAGKGKVAEIRLFPGKTLTVKEVAKVGVNYYKQLQKVSKKTPITTRIVNKLRNPRSK